MQASEALLFPIGNVRLNGIFFLMPVSFWCTQCQSQILCRYAIDSMFSTS